MNYTKGEWKVEDATQVVVGERLVANTGGYSTNYTLEREQNEANARLIAAAPDMYEALKDIIEQAEKTHFPIGADLANSIRVFGKQAIAKSERKSHA